MFGARYFGSRYYGSRYFGGGGESLAPQEDISGTGGVSNYHGLARDYLDRFRKKQREDEEKAERLEELRREAERSAEVEPIAEDAPPTKKKRKTITLKKEIEEPDYSTEIALAKSRIDQQIAAIEEEERQRDIAEAAYLLGVAQQAEMQRMLADEEDAIILLLM